MSRYGCKSFEAISIVNMSRLRGRRSGALYDPEVKDVAATFRDLLEMHTGRIDMTRAVSKLDRLTERPV